MRGRPPAVSWRPDAGEIDGLAAAKLFAQVRDPRLGKVRAELMKARGTQPPRSEPLPGAKSDIPEPGCRGPIRLFTFNSLGPASH
jgi:hypothetical protein